VTKTNLLHVRLTPEEMDIVTIDAGLRGITVSEYVRSLIRTSGKKAITPAEVSSCHCEHVT
jgi:hypothetical protein